MVLPLLVNEDIKLKQIVMCIKDTAKHTKDEIFICQDEDLVGNNTEFYQSAELIGVIDKTIAPGNFYVDLGKNIGEGTMSFAEEGEILPKTAKRIVASTFQVKDADGDEINIIPLQDIYVRQLIHHINKEKVPIYCTVTTELQENPTIWTIQGFMKAGFTVEEHEVGVVLEIVKDNVESLEDSSDKEQLIPLYEHLKLVGERILSKQ